MLTATYGSEIPGWLYTDQVFSFSYLLFVKVPIVYDGRVHSCAPEYIVVNLYGDLIVVHTHSFKVAHCFWAYQYGKYSSYKVGASPMVWTSFGTADW